MKHKSLLFAKLDTHQMLLCSSVRMRRRNLPSQLGTLVYGIIIIILIIIIIIIIMIITCGMTTYSPGGSVKKVTTSLATEWFVTSCTHSHLNNRLSLFVKLQKALIFWVC